jgi:hypothetical protein
MHRGLAGSRRTAKGILRQARERLEPVAEIFEAAPEARERLALFETHAVDETAGLFRSARAIWLRPLAWITKSRVLRSIRVVDPALARDPKLRPAIRKYLSEVCRAGELRLFEQLFALWHAIHIPLTIILFVSAFIHVVAVHLY